ncbi:hypothetical protein C8R44DRAFT_639722, partial [Mycena epipterygia]
DSQDYSCGYDTFFTILGNLCMKNPAAWSARFCELSPILTAFAANMMSVHSRRLAFESARNTARWALHVGDPIAFPYGYNPTMIDRIAHKVLPSKYYAVGRQHCTMCGCFDDNTYGMLQLYLSADKYMVTGRQRCKHCVLVGVRNKMKMTTHIRDVPTVMFFDINRPKLKFNRVLNIKCGGVEIKLRLRGVIYGGQRHFTCRYFELNGRSWFHDGITAGSGCVHEFLFDDITDSLSLHQCGEKLAVSVIYART